MRACPGCGMLEDRKVNERGHEVVNLSPLTGECLDCLVRNAGAKPKPMPSEPFDAKQAQTGDKD